MNDEEMKGANVGGEILPAASGLSGEDAAQISALLEKGYEAYEKEDSSTVALCCEGILKIDPDNLDAWMLLAKYAGWDARQYTTDFPAAMKAISYAIELHPEASRFDAAVEIYTARKKQIAYKLESDMMMPSWTGAKNLQATMELWLAYLKEIPYLSAEVIRSEITLCDNLCLRSKMSIMPGDRLVYTAYATLNNKVSYGDMFRSELAARLEAQQRANQAQVEGALEDARQRMEDCQVLLDGGDLGERERAQLEEHLAALLKDAEDIAAISNEATYELEIEELERKLAKVKPYKLFKKTELNGRLAGLREKLDEAVRETEAVTGPILQMAAKVKEALEQ